jgi:hypothetical protein
VLRAALSLGVPALLAGLLACGGDSPSGSTPPPSTAPPTTLRDPTLADLSASVSSPQADLRRINCRVDVVARVTLTNRAPSSVSVRGVRRTSRIAGGCSPAPPFTFAPLVRFVAGNSTAVVLERPLYSDGSGCCFENSRCDGSATCAIEEVIVVDTGVGEVAAGSFVYRVNFDGCADCDRLTASGRGLCAPAAP